MVALRGKEIDTFLARPDPGRPIILLYGSDAGLVRERADALLASAVDDPHDPFSLVKLDGDELSAEPSRLIDDELRASNLRISSDARAVLMTLLGGDRQASRNELRKLTLYGHGRGEVTFDDVMAVAADASELKIDPIVDAAFAGNPAIVETEFGKAMVAGTYPGVVISAAQRHAAWLHKSALAIAEGTPVSAVVESGFPRLHFSRKASVETALRQLNAARLMLIIEQLATAALEMRKQATLAAVIAQRALMAIAVNARRRG